MKYFLALALCLTAATATAAPVRDFSMPVDESIRHANEAPSRTTTDGWNTNSSSNYRFPTRDDDYEPTQRGPAKHFMDGYCDPNFTPGIARRGVSAACIKQNKDEACSLYSRVPKDVKKAVNLAIDCVYVGEMEDDENGERAASPAGCENASDNRLQLLKKYIDDRDLTQALLFLPEDVLGGSDECVAVRR